MRFHLNLATHPYADPGPMLRRLRIASGVLGLVSLSLGIALCFVHRRAEEVRGRIRLLEVERARVNRERQMYLAMMRQPENAAVVTQVRDLNQIFAEKAFSWTLAMEDLETVLPSRVQVTTLEPARDKDGQITLRLRVLGPRDRSLELLQNLEHSRRFFRPRIVGESSESSGGPNEKLEPVSESNRVNFDLLADYNPAVPNDLIPGKPIASTAKDPSGPASPQHSKAETKLYPVGGVSKPTPSLHAQLGGHS